jgi:hypothetical protein
VYTASLVVYILGLRLLTSNFVLIFIITMLLLAVDFYYLKNIAGRRLVGLRWWNEVDPNTGDGRWVFESLDPETGREINATDKRFFWLALYAQPVLWVLLAIVALVSFEPIWLTLVGMCNSDSSTRYLEEGFEVDKANNSRSHCACSHHYQHACLFTMRQVQPSDRFRFERHVWIRSCEEPRWWHDQRAV